MCTNRRNQFVPLSENSETNLELSPCYVGVVTGKATRRTNCSRTILPLRNGSKSIKSIYRQ